MLRSLAICSIVLMLAVGAAAGWWFGMRDGDVPSIADIAEMVEPEKETPAVQTVELEPLTFPVLRGGAVRELVTYVVRLEVGAASERAVVKSRRPSVRDALLSELHELYAYRFVRERADELALVKRHLLEVAREAAGVPVERVLLKAVAHRPQ